MLFKLEMSCLICFEDNFELITMKNCNCKVNLHKKCYNNYRSKSDFECIFCRKIHVNNNNTIFNNILFFLGKIPFPVSLIIWIIFCFLFIIFFILPLMILKLFKSKFYRPS